jgi:hypothetical protein
MRRLRRVNRWCLRHAGVTLGQWLGYGAAFAAVSWTCCTAMAVLAR